MTTSHLFVRCPVARHGSLWEVNLAAPWRPNFVVTRMCGISAEGVKKSESERIKV